MGFVLREWEKLRNSVNLLTTGDPALQSETSSMDGSDVALLNRNGSLTGTRVSSVSVTTAGSTDTRST